MTAWADNVLKRITDLEVQMHALAERETVEHARHSRDGQRLSRQTERALLTEETFHLADDIGSAAAAAAASAPVGSPFVTWQADATLTAERTATSGTSITFDVATPGQIIAKRAALTGDVAASADSNTTTIQAGVVTLAMMANLAADRLIGRGNGGGAGVPQAISLGAGLALTGTVLDVVGGSGATTALDNLASVAINTALLPGATGTIDVGSTAKAFRDFYTDYANGGYTITHGGTTDAIAFRAANDGAGGIEIKYLNVGGYARTLTVDMEGGVSFLYRLRASGTTVFNVLDSGATSIPHGAFLGIDSATAPISGFVTASINTTDATVTTLYSYTLADQSIAGFFVMVVARRVDTGTENAIFRRTFRAYREGGGAVISGTVDTIGTDDQLTMSGAVTIDASGNDVRVRVTGQAAKTIQWKALVQVLRAVP